MTHRAPGDHDHPPRPDHNLAASPAARLLTWAFPARFRRRYGSEFCSAFALAAGGALRALVYGIGANDPLTPGVVGVLLPAVGLAASAFPARRTTHIDPVEALREA